MDPQTAYPYRWIAGAFVVVAAVVLLVTAALLDRYQIDAIANRYGAGVFVLDRWAGTVSICDPQPTWHCDVIYRRSDTHNN